ncbi:MAG: hypothetical protein NT069_08225 [Planctomycetota bacterium]|nr:hypothetical protein [Planctomycetota bacterium]
MWTFFGSAIDLRNPSVVPFREMRGITASLGNQARFLGHTKQHYSVAEHSYHCWAVAPQQYKWAALLHDVHEAVVGDVTSPWKSLLPETLQYERMWKEAAAKAFAIEWDYELTAAIKVIDEAMLATEMRDLVCKTDFEVTRGLGIVPLSLSLTHLKPPSSAPSWGAAWADTFHAMQAAMYSEDAESNFPEIPECYEVAGCSFGLTAARRRIAFDIRKRLGRE